jgi:hypothetical protein
MARAKVALSFLVTLVVALAAAPESMRVADAQAKLVPVKIPSGRLTARKTVSLGGQTVGTVTDGVDVEVAVNPDKNYVLYETDCTGYVLAERGSDEDDRCRRDVQNAQAAREGEDTCRRCRRIVGYIDRGGVWRDGPSAPAGETGRNPMTRPIVLIPIAAAAAGGTALALRGEDAPPTPPFAGLNFTVQLNLQGNNGCPAFTPTAAVTMSFNADPNTGTGPLSVQYAGGASVTNYPNARAVRNGANFDITATGASVLTPVRNFSARLQATVQAAVGAGTTVVRFAETFTQLNGPGSPCDQIFSF